MPILPALDVTAEQLQLHTDVNFKAASEYVDSTAETQVMNADILVGMSRYLNQLVVNPKNITSLRGLRRYTQDSPAEGYPDIDTATWDDALDTQVWNNTDPRFWDAYKKVLYYGGEGGLLGAIERDRLDALRFPLDWSGLRAPRTDGLVQN